MMQSSKEYISLIDQFNYDDNVKDILKKIYLPLVNYFHNEEMVYNTLKNVKIIFTNNVKDYLSLNGYLDETAGEMVSSKTLKILSGVYSTIPIVSYNDADKSFHLDSVKRTIVVANYLSDDLKKAALIHEICHAIKSYHNEYIIKDHLLFQSSGLIKKTYKLTKENTLVNKKLLEETNVGLEEGFNSLAEEQIMREVFSACYESCGFKVVSTAALNFENIDFQIFHDLIIKAELYHDLSIININYDSFTKLNKVVDKLYLKLLNIYSSCSYDSEEYKKDCKDLLDVINDEYIPLNKQMYNEFLKERGGSNA